MKMAAAWLVIGLFAACALGQTGEGRKPEQPGPAKAAAAKRSIPESPRRHSAVAALMKWVRQAEFDNTALREALDQLARAGHINIVVRWNKLAAAGVEPSTPISVSIRDVRFGEALRMVLEAAAPPEQELAYRATRDAIQVSTAADINSEMIVRIYPIADIVAEEGESAFIGVEHQTAYVAQLNPVVGPGAAAQQPVVGTVNVGSRLQVGRGNPRDDENDRQPPRTRGASGDRWIDQLIDVIVTTVAPESWDVNGGRGTIREYRGSLIIRNSIYVHQQLAGMLRDSTHP